MGPSQKQCPKSEELFVLEGVTLWPPQTSAPPPPPPGANPRYVPVEEQVLGNMDNVPHIYKRYINDIYVSVDYEDDLQTLRPSTEYASVLKFTCEFRGNE